MRKNTTINSIVRYFLHNQFIVAILFLIIGWFLLEIREVLMLLFVAYIIMAAVAPLVEFLHGKGVPRTFAAGIVYVSTVAIVVLLVVPLVPFFIGQVQSLFASFPSFMNKAASFLGIDGKSLELSSFISSQVDLIGRNAFTVTSKLFGGLFSVILVLVISFYMLSDHMKIKRGIAGLFSEDMEKHVLLTMNQIDEKLGAWLRGQIVLSFVIGLFTWIVLTILGLEYALPLAILAGILEVIPTIGPILSAVPAVIVALAVSPALTITVIIAYVVIQMLENNILVPKIMQRAVGLNPIIVIIGVTTGTKLMGVFGGLLSIPFIAMLVIIFNSVKALDTNE